jgi:hypothetical protein
LSYPTSPHDEEVETTLVDVEDVDVIRLKEGVTDILELAEDVEEGADLVEVELE